MVFGFTENCCTFGVRNSSPCLTGILKPTNHLPHRVLRRTIFQCLSLDCFAAVGIFCLISNQLTMRNSPETSPSVSPGTERAVHQFMYEHDDLENLIQSLTDIYDAFQGSPRNEILLPAERAQLSYDFHEVTSLLYRLEASRGSQGLVVNENGILKTEGGKYE